MLDYFAFFATLGASILADALALAYIAGGF